MRDLRLRPGCRRNLRSSGLLRRVEWSFCANVSGQPARSIFKDQVVTSSSWTSRAWTMGPIGCPETLVRNCHSTLRNIPEQRRSQKKVKSRSGELEFHPHISKCLPKWWGRVKISGQKPRVHFFALFIYLFTHACALLNETVCISQTNSIESFNDH